jgi:hypothetical protein
VIISAISMIISSFDSSSIGIFCCMIGVFCTNLAIYSTQKKKKENDTK